MLTLDDAILHSQEKAKAHCGECAKEHQQLADWLLELKDLRRRIGSISNDLPDTILVEPISSSVLKKLTLDTKVGFAPNNQVFYSQDFSVCRGIDSNVVFTVTNHFDSGVWLSAPGYGGTPYGNGRILVLYNQKIFKKEK
jgi:hypothetical protein